MFMFLSEREKNLDDVLKMDTFPSRAGRFTKLLTETVIAVFRSFDKTSW